MSGTLMVRLTPAGGADRIDGVGRDDAGRIFLRARVRAAAEDNKANRALEALLAETLSVAKSQVRVAQGAKARLKMVRIEGVDAAAIEALFARHAEET